MSSRDNAQPIDEETLFWVWVDDDDFPVTGIRHRSPITAYNWRYRSLPKHAPSTVGLEEQRAKCANLKKAQLSFVPLTDQEQADLASLRRLHGHS